MVQRYLERSGVVGKPFIEKVKLWQSGRFRQGAERPWMGLTAVEEYTIDPPSLVWRARFSIARFPLLRAKDQYQVRRGHMFGKLLGLFTVFDMRGEALDQATMIRYLNEVMWFPTAYLGPNMAWEEIDDQTAGVAFSDQGKRVSATLHFDDQGRLTNFRANRFRETGGKFSLDPWSTPMTGYGRLSGLMLPTQGKAVWHLPGGDLSYAELKVTALEYNGGSWPLPGSGKA
jgi:hypothetical protein